MGLMNKEIRFSLALGIIALTTGACRIAGPGFDASANFVPGNKVPTDFNVQGTVADKGLLFQGGVDPSRQSAEISVDGIENNPGVTNFYGLISAYKDQNGSEVKIKK